MTVYQPNNDFTTLIAFEKPYRKLGSTWKYEQLWSYDRQYFQGS